MNKQLIFFTILLFFIAIGVSACANNRSETIMPTSTQNDSTKPLETKKTTEVSTDKKPYETAYKEFLLQSETNNTDDLPIYGYYLLDINFDKTPELGILHFSGGSMGGYFLYYYFDGYKISPIIDDQGNPARSSNNIKIFADNENKKVYLLKEMYLMQGNENGVYGYIREINNENNIPYVNYVLDLKVEQCLDSSKYLEIHHINEDDFLNDDSIDDCLRTNYYVDDNWIEITSKEYLALKRDMIPLDNNFTDLLNTDNNFLLYNSTQEMFDEKLVYKFKKITEQEIENLFDKWDAFIGK